jgi:hypothetical protein
LANALSRGAKAVACPSCAAGISQDGAFDLLRAPSVERGLECGADWITTRFRLFLLQANFLAVVLRPSQPNKITLTLSAVRGPSASKSANYSSADAKAQNALM